MEMETLLENKEICTPSRMFNPAITLGLVSNEIPCLVRIVYIRRQPFVVTCEGRGFNTYAGTGLVLISKSPVHPYTIGCMAVDSYHVYTGVGNYIYVWRRGKELQRVYSGSGSDVVKLLSFPPSLLSLHEDDSILVWDVTEATFTQLPPFDIEGKITAMIHPATYINKILFGSSTGCMVLFNIQSGQLIHKFKNLNSRIIQIIEAQALDVVGIALEDGRILIHNLKTDTTLFKFHSLETPSSIAFLFGPMSRLMCGTNVGSISVWDLDKSLMIAHKEGCHGAAVTGLGAFPGEPYFVSSSADNSVAVWAFDMPDGSFRLYNKREGHSQPSSRVRFFGSSNTNAKDILSTGLDGSLRKFHLHVERINQKVSRKDRFIELFPNFGQFPTMMDFTAQSTVRPTIHEDMVARHAGQVGLSTWSYHSLKSANRLLVLPKYKNIPNVKIECTCLALTSCCQFVIAGYDNGTVERYNLQSGKHRKTYGRPAHSGAVRGVACDQVKIRVFSGGNDEFIRFWDFDTGNLYSKLAMEAGISFIHNKNSNFAAVSLDNFDIYVIDILGCQILRKFTVPSGPLLDACFSADNIFLIASGADSCVRTWNITHGYLVDIFRHQSMITSLDFSFTGEYMIGSMHDSVGIFVWKNKLLFEPCALGPMDENAEPPLLGVVGKLHPSIELMKEHHNDLGYQSAVQIEENLLTLSQLPASRWKNLLDIHEIRKRNKPKEAPKNYVAPFYLTDKVVSPKDELTDVEMSTFSDPQNSTTYDGEPIPKILKLDISPFQQSLLSTTHPVTKAQASGILQILESMGPARIHDEIQNLSPDNGGSLDLMKSFIRFASRCTQSKRSFETGQAYLAIFLKTHATMIQADESLLTELEKLEDHIPARQLSRLMTNIKGFVKHIKSKLF